MRARAAASSEQNSPGNRKSCKRGSSVTYAVSKVAVLTRQRNDRAPAPAPLRVCLYQSAHELRVSTQHWLGEEMDVLRRGFFHWVRDVGGPHSRASVGGVWSVRARVAREPVAGCDLRNPLAIRRLYRAIPSSLLQLGEGRAKLDTERHGGRR